MWYNHTYESIYMRHVYVLVPQALFKAEQAGRRRLFVVRENITFPNMYVVDNTNCIFINMYCICAFSKTLNRHGTTLKTAAGV